ncbi:hypothetical protein IFR05_002751 [Cadophora sp. M221]|nr:hypothetical protein IFR05_002751 [Cadophora sp. M221]
MLLRRNLWAVVGLIGIAQAQYVNTTETPSPTPELGDDRKSNPTPTPKPNTCEASTVTLPAPYCHPTTVTLPAPYCHPTTVTCYVTLDKYHHYDRLCIYNSDQRRDLNSNSNLDVGRIYYSKDNREADGNGETDGNGKADKDREADVCHHSYRGDNHNHNNHGNFSHNKCGDDVLSVQCYNHQFLWLPCHNYSLENDNVDYYNQNSNYGPNNDNDDQYRPNHVHDDEKYHFHDVISIHCHQRPYDMENFDHYHRLNIQNYKYLDSPNNDNYDRDGDFHIHICDHLLNNIDQVYVRLLFAPCIAIGFFYTRFELPFQLYCLALTAPSFRSYPFTVISDHTTTTTVYSFSTYTTVSTSLSTLTSKITDTTTATAIETSKITDTTTATATETSRITDTTTEAATAIETSKITDTTTATAIETSKITDTTTATDTATDTSFITDSTTTTTTSISTLLFTTTTTLPASTVTTSISGSLTTITIPPITETTTSTSLITLPGVVTTLPGIVTTLPGQVTTLPGVVTTLAGVVTTLPGQVTTVPGLVTTITAPGPTVTIPPVFNTITVPGPTVIGPGVTVTVNGLVVCPKPTNTPGVVVTPQDSGPNALWGCSPGYVCDLPKPAGCTVFADPPDYDFLCDAKYCIPSPPFPTVVWPKGETSYYPITEGYFNLNPQAFGLDFTIFVTNVVVITVTGKHGKETVQTVTTGDYSSQASLTHFGSTDIPTSTLVITPSITPTTYAAATGSAHAHWKKARDVIHLLKRDDTIVPAVCYATCNNCYIEAQSVGLSPELCATGSAFRSSYEACQQCVQSSDPTTATDPLKVYVEPKFAKFVDFCAAQAPIPVLQSTSTATVIPVPATQSVVVATETAPTPTISVAITSQVPAVTSTPAAITSQVPAVTSTPVPIPTTTSSSPPTTTSALVQVTGNMAAGSRQSSFTMMVSVLFFSIMAVFL